MLAGIPVTDADVETLAGLLREVELPNITDRERAFSKGLPRAQLV
jgi:hypothetical protein